MTLSTASSPKYWQTTLLPTITINGVSHIDVLADRLVDLIETITTAIPYTVREGDKLTTVCYQFYQTTSLYYLILTYNGLLFWDEVSPGDIIQIPDLSQINSFFGRNRQQTRQRITI